MKKATDRSSEAGTALITVLMLLGLISSLLAAYYFLTRVELSTTKSSMDGTQGFYAAEGGLNLRAERIRQEFLGYNRPAGTSPAVVGGQMPCTGGDPGSGDFQCENLFFESHNVATFVEEDPGNPTMIVVPPGEPFQNLHAQEYLYIVSSVASNSRDGLPEAILEMDFKSRLVAMFQFAAFYNKDLEILPGPAMTLNGPVHSNGDLYFDSGASLTVDSQVSTAQKLYHGRKDQDSCAGGGVQVYDPAAPRALPACGPGRIEIAGGDVGPWNGMIKLGVDPLTVPAPEALDPTPGQVYWDRADIRIMLDLNDVTPTIEVRNADGTTNALDSGTLNGCGAASPSDTLYNNREGTYIEMLDVDVEQMLDCLHANNLLGVGKDLDEPSDGGLVLYLGVDGPDSNVVNNYGVRVTNGGELDSTLPTAPQIRGLTVVTNQAVYIEGDYNAVNKKPAAFLADSLNILSNNWQDANSNQALNLRLASSTTINAAFLSGTDTTGGIEGTAGQSGGAYNGGLENYPRFHEDWTGRTLTYRGSLVSLNTPRHVDGPWNGWGNQYAPPVRNWSYDTDFNDAANLPPLTPRFVYLKQEMFTRDFEL